MKHGPARVTIPFAFTAVVVGSCHCGARADDLSALQQQLIGLQHRLDSFEEAGLARPGAASRNHWSFRIVRGSLLDPHHRTEDGQSPAEDRGLTIQLSPVADAPVARHQVTVSGFVKGNVIYDVDDNLGDVFDVGAISTGADTGPHFRLHARHTRLSIRSKSDTTVGPVSTYIESDFFGGGGDERISSSYGFRVRHAWADWGATDHWTIGVGQTWSNFMAGFALPPSVDVRGPAGRSFIRQGQVRLTYNPGPWEIAVAAENPETDIQAGLTPGGGGPAGAVCNESSAPNSCGADDRLPDFTARIFHETPDGHAFQVSGVLRELRTDGDAAAIGFGGTDSIIGWGLLVAASLDFDPVTARLQATYGDGIGRYGSQYHGNRAAIARDPADIDLETVEAFSLLASLSVDVTERSKVTVAYGRVDFSRQDTLTGQSSSLQNVYVNWLYQPVSALRFGVEANWGERRVRGGGREDALRFGFATWFYF